MRWQAMLHRKIDRRPKCHSTAHHAGVETSCDLIMGQNSRHAQSTCNATCMHTTSCMHACTCRARASPAVGKRLTMLLGVRGPRNECFCPLTNTELWSPRRDQTNCAPSLRSPFGPIAKTPIANEKERLIVSMILAEETAVEKMKQKLGAWP